MNGSDKAMTLEELKTFHNLDRILYVRLTDRLGINPYISMKLVAFLNWLESCGYSKVVYKFLQLPDSDFFIFTTITSYYLKFLFTRTASKEIAIEVQTRKIPILLGHDFSHWLLYENRDIALLEMSQFVEDVCAAVFCDLSDKVYENNRTLLAQLNGPKKSIHCVLAKRKDLNLFHTKGLQELQDFSLWRHSKKERTLVVSFFKTHPISRDQLYDIFARQYGARVLTIDMKDEPENINNQPSVIFARVVLNCREEMKKILEGNEKYCVLSSRSGRVIFVRRFVTLKEANDIHKVSEKEKQTQEFVSTESNQA